MWLSHSIHNMNLKVYSYGFETLPLYERILVYRYFIIFPLNLGTDKLKVGIPSVRNNRYQFD